MRVVDDVMVGRCTGNLLREDGGLRMLGAHDVLNLRG